MSHYALIVPVWTGHMNPMTTLGQELQRRGHRVTVISFPDAEAAVSRRGLEFLPLGEGVFPAGQWDRLGIALSRRSGFGAARFTLQWVARMTRVFLEELPTLLRRHEFGGVLLDQVCCGAECVLEDLQIPTVAVCNALPVHPQPDIPVHSETWAWSDGWLPRVRNRLMQQVFVLAAAPVFRQVRDARKAAGRPWNVWRHLNEIPPSLAQVAQLPACLDFPRRHAPDHFHHTGPWHVKRGATEAGFGASWLDPGRPLIYASLGTLQNGLEGVFQTILDACAPLPVQLVLAQGRDHGPRPARVPDNARVLGYAPQLALLQRANLVITHAGLNTTLESLSCGLPMVALPITNEQPGIAARIRHAGVGEFLPLRRLTPDRLRGLVERVGSTPGYRERARACARELERVDGLRKAADIAEEAFRERVRVRAR